MKHALYITSSFAHFSYCPSFAYVSSLAPAALFMVQRLEEISLPFALAQCGTRQFSLASEVSPPSPNLCESGETPYSDRCGNTESTPKLQRLHAYLISFNNGASTIVMYGRRLFSLLEQRLEFLFQFKMYITDVPIFSLKLIECDL